jgi:predicted nucleic acid-binding protein
LRAALVDSSAFLSLEDPDERSHERCIAILDDLISTGVRLLTTNFVFDETYALILTRLSRARAVAWGASLKRGQLVRLLRVSEDHEARAWDILTAFEDKEFSYTDATSFAVAESLGVESTFSLDQHFKQFGSFAVLP